MKVTTYHLKAHLSEGRAQGVPGVGGLTRRRIAAYLLGCAQLGGNLPSLVLPLESLLLCCQPHLVPFLLQLLQLHTAAALSPAPIENTLA